MINKLISKQQVSCLEFEGWPSDDFAAGYTRAINDVLDLEPISALAVDEVRRMLTDIYYEGVNMTGEYQGCWVRFKDIERIVEKYTGGKEGEA